MVDLANADGPVLLRLLGVLQSEVVEHLRAGIVLERAVQVVRHLPLCSAARLLAHSAGGGDRFVRLDDHPANVRGLPTVCKDCAAWTIAAPCPIRVAARQASHCDMISGLPSWAQRTNQAPPHRPQFVLHEPLSDGEVVHRLVGVAGERTRPRGSARGNASRRPLRPAAKISQ